MGIYIRNLRFAFKTLYVRACRGYMTSAAEALEPLGPCSLSCNGLTMRVLECYRSGCSRWTMDFPLDSGGHVYDESHGSPMALTGSGAGSSVLARFLARGAGFGGFDEGSLGDAAPQPSRGITTTINITSSTLTTTSITIMITSPFHVVNTQLQARTAAVRSRTSLSHCWRMAALRTWCNSKVH